MFPLMVQDVGLRCRFQMSVKKSVMDNVACDKESQLDKHNVEPQQTAFDAKDTGRIRPI